jgi:hypothetical protein
MSQRECEQIYDPATGMTRQEWSSACRRVGKRLERQRLDSLQQKPQRR